MVELSGFLYSDAGAPVNTSCCSVDIFPTVCNVGATGGTPTASTDTNACGFWTLSGVADGDYDVRITNSSSVRFIRFDNEQQICRLEGNTFKLGDANNLIFGAGCDFQLRWSTADCSNHAAVIGVGDTSQQLHITDAAAIATDWVRSAGTHPELSIHSNTTPVSDYLAIGNHDGTTATIDVVGGTTLSLDIAGSVELTVTSAGLNLPANSDINFTGTTGTNDIVLVNGLADALSITDGAADIMVFSTSGGTNTIAITGTLAGTGGTTGMDIDAAGIITMAAQPYVLAHNSSSDSNVTGAGAAATVGGSGEMIGPVTCD